jgi:hypothetical protein
VNDDTSAFTTAKSYSEKLPLALENPVSVDGQLTAKMLLATPNNVARKVKKQNLFVGMKMLSVLEINPSGEYFRCRVKVLMNWRVVPDGSSKSFTELLRQVRQFQQHTLSNPQVSSHSTHEHTCLPDLRLKQSLRSQCKLLMGSNRVPELKIQSVSCDISSESIVMTYRTDTAEYFGLHSYEAVLQIYEIMELQDFPFDQQRLHFVFALQGQTKEKYTMCFHQLDFKCTHDEVRLHSLPLPLTPPPPPLAPTLTPTTPLLSLPSLPPPLT